MGEYDAGQQDGDKLAGCHDDGEQQGTKGFDGMDDEQLACKHMRCCPYSTTPGGVVCGGGVRLLDL